MNDHLPMGQITGLDDDDYEPHAPRWLHPKSVGKAGEILSMIATSSDEGLSWFEDDMFLKEKHKRVLYLNFVSIIRSAFPGNNDPVEFLTELKNSGLVQWTPKAQFVVPICRVKRVEAGETAVLVATDSPIAETRDRVFPWPDEGELLVENILSQWSGGEPRTILDACCGAGTAGLLLAKIWPNAEVIGLDRNQRAIEYANFNADLNKLGNFRGIQHEICPDAPIPEELTGMKFDIICVDPPFTKLPQKMMKDKYRRRHSAGGELGNYLATLPLCTEIGGLYMILCYALGKKGPKELEEHTELDKAVNECYPKECPELTVKKVDAKIWRLFGEKRYPRNPMPVEYMAPRFFDPDWRKAFLRAGYSYEKYVSWIEDTLVKSGKDQLYYLAAWFQK